MSIVAAPPGRAWMDATPKHFANRCLPMLIANQAGWLLLSPGRVTVAWDGGTGIDALKVEVTGDAPPTFASSHFGHGILTFNVSYLFRTSPGWNLYVRGPANSPKDGIHALEGLVETDWSEATFTMNWKLTRPNHTIVFEEGEPIAMVSPMRRREIEEFRPELRLLASNPELDAGYRAWSASRGQFNADLKVPGSQARQDSWQRHYMRGKTVAEERASEHQTGLKLAEFEPK